MKNKSLGQSFKNAFNGLYQAATSERNMQIHMGALVLVVLAGIVLKLDLTRWMILVLTVGGVLISELLNTAIENLTDMVTTEYSREAGKVKDIAAAAVLVSAIVSVVAGILVFYGPLIDWFKGLVGRK